MKVVLILLCSLSLTKPSEFPAVFDRCSADDGKCLDQAIENAVHYLCEKGLPELKIPKLDPIVIPQINIGTKSNSLDILQIYNDVNLAGYRRAKVKNSKLDAKKNIIKFTMVIPELKQTSNYNMTGRLLVFPVFGNGRSTIVQSNVTVIHKIKFEFDKEKDKHLNPKSYAITVKPEKMRFQFGNLFNGNKLLSSRIHAVVNENWEVIWGDVSKDFEEAYGNVFHSFALKFFEKVAVADIFL
ncbi:hypothetical protein JTB14_022558 [Gonioctena quinquepunctata]|nr:hypothetical protein JTB14_022558 [Gonioctena quinquepunctata]